MDASVTESALPKQLADLVIEIDHVAIAVEDLEVAIRWYSRGLGLSVVERRTTKGERTSMKSAVLKAGRTIIVLIQGVEPDSQVARFIEHFGPGVPAPRAGGARSRCCAGGLARRRRRD